MDRSSVSLQKRFITNSSVVLAIILTIVFIGITIVSQGRLKDATDTEVVRLKEGLNEKGELLTSLISNISAVPMMSSDQYSLNSYAKQLLDDDKDIVKVEFINTEGKAILSLPVQDSLKDINESELLIFEKPIVTDKQKMGFEKQFGVLKVYVNPARVNSVTAESEERLAKVRMQQIITFSIVGFAVIIIISLTLYLLLKGIVTKPVNEGISLINRISHNGDLSIDITREFESAASSMETSMLATSIQEIVKSQKEIAVMTEKMSKGSWNLSIEERSGDDELLLTLKDMVRSVNDTLLKVKEMSNHVDIVSQQLAQAGQSIASGANEQAGNIDNIAHSMKKLVVDAEDTAKNVSKARGNSQKVSNDANTGNEQMVELTSAMEEIKGSSNKIQKIIKTIDDIAFQTNLLALNAAVEAARAGQHGKGFAVVAEEVRSLASRSAKAAKETAVLIQDSNTRVDNGMVIAEKTASSLSDIVEGVKEINDSLGDISNATEMQVSAINQTNESIGRIESITAQNSATSEETASIAQELSHHSKELNSLIQMFELDEDESEAVAYSGEEYA